MKNAYWPCSPTRLLVGVLSGLVLCATGAAYGATSSNAAVVTTPSDVHVIAVGDIACGINYAPVTPTTCQQDATANLAVSLAPKYALVLGDLAYNAGSYANLMAGYDPTWGQKLKSITKPVPGNHESGSKGLAGYFQYFGSRATPMEPTCLSFCKGYYSFSTGSWHVIALNTSSCSEGLGTCGDFTEQAAWITADIKAHPNKCTVAILHNPLWSFGNSATPPVAPLYAALAAGGVDLILAGHAHNYQRFAAQDMTGMPSATGMTEYIVGTGGVNQQPVGKSAVRNRLAAFVDFGVLDLTLSPKGWTSSFKNLAGATLDPAKGVCH